MEIRGVVIDAVFHDKLPEIFHALRIAVPEQDGRPGVRPHRRGAAAPRQRPRPRRGDGLHRRPRRAAWTSRTPARRSRCPSASRPSAASSTSSASRSTRATTPRLEGALADPPAGSDPRRAGADDRGLRDRHQGHRPRRPVRQGRQDRPLRRRRPRQDRAHPGADPERRPGARRLLGLRGRRRALARGQRPLARDDRVRESSTRRRSSSAR